MRARVAIATLLASVLLTACGGSSSRSSSSSPSTTTKTASTGASSTTAATTSATATATATTSRPPEVPKSKASHVPHSRPVPPDTGVRIPASFTIPAGNRLLVPPLVSVPKYITVDLRVRNLDSKGHDVRLDAPHEYTTHLAAGATSNAQISGLPDGTYRLLIDGAVRGRIVVGSVPGP